MPWWLTAVVVARDVMIGGGAVIYRFWFGPLHGRPTILSKINTGMQLAVVLAADSRRRDRRCRRRRWSRRWPSSPC